MGGNASLKLEELGDLASIIPEHEPKLELSVDRIPVSETAGKIIPVCEPDLRGREPKVVFEAIVFLRPASILMSLRNTLTPFRSKVWNNLHQRYDLRVW